MPPVSAATKIGNEGRKLEKIVAALEVRKGTSAFEPQLQTVQHIANSLRQLCTLVRNMSNVPGRPRSTVHEMLVSEDQMDDYANVIEEILGNPDYPLTRTWTEDAITQTLHLISEGLKAMRLVPDPTRPTKELSYRRKVPTDSNLNKRIDRTDKMD